MTQQTEIPMSDTASIQTPVPGALQARYGITATAMVASIARLFAVGP